MLLWRCPLCAANDALQHIRRPLRADRVCCSRCGAEWRLRRVPGEGFYLKVIRGAEAGDERPLAAWYEAMKRTVELVPLADPTLPLEPGESLYLASRPALVQAEEGDPLFFPCDSSSSKREGVEREPSPAGGEGRVRGGLAPWEALAGSDSHPHPLPSPSEGEGDTRDKRDVRGVVAGWGRLFLTERRLIWQGEAGTALIPLQRVNSAYALMDFALAILVGMRLYTVYLPHESVLKWVTYLALVAQQVSATSGHRITTSHY